MCLERLTHWNNKIIIMATAHLFQFVDCSKMIASRLIYFGKKQTSRNLMNKVSAPKADTSQANCMFHYRTVTVQQWKQNEVEVTFKLLHNRVYMYNIASQDKSYVTKSKSINMPTIARSSLLRVISSKITTPSEEVPSNKNHSPSEEEAMNKDSDDKTSEREKSNSGMGGKSHSQKKAPLTGSVSFFVCIEPYLLNIQLDKC